MFLSDQMLDFEEVRVLLEDRVRSKEKEKNTTRYTLVLVIQLMSPFMESSWVKNLGYIKCNQTLILPPRGSIVCGKSKGTRTGIILGLTI